MEVWNVGTRERRSVIAEQISVYRILMGIHGAGLLSRVETVLRSCGTTADVGQMRA